MVSLGNKAGPGIVLIPAEIAVKVFIAQLEEHHSVFVSERACGAVLLWCGVVWCGCGVVWWGVVLCVSVVRCDVVYMCVRSGVMWCMRVYYCVRKLTLDTPNATRESQCNRCLHRFLFSLSVLVPITGTLPTEKPGV